MTERDLEDLRTRMKRALEDPKKVAEVAVAALRSPYNAYKVVLESTKDKQLAQDWRNTLMLQRDQEKYKIDFSKELSSLFPGEKQEATSLENKSKQEEEMNENIKNLKEEYQEIFRKAGKENALTNIANFFRFLSNLWRNLKLFGWGFDFYTQDEIKAKIVFWKSGISEDIAAEIFWVGIRDNTPMNQYCCLKVQKTGWLSKTVARGEEVLDWLMENARKGEVKIRRTEEEASSCQYLRKGSTTKPPTLVLICECNEILEEEKKRHLEQAEEIDKKFIEERFKRPFVVVENIDICRACTHWKK